MLRAILMVAVLLLVSCEPAATPSPSDTAHVITGNLVLLGGSDAFTSTGSTCAGEGGYSDISEGAQITVKNEAGVVIGTGSLNAGRRMASTSCSFAIFVGGVPDATFYSIEVSHRGELTYSKAEMEASDWTVALTLGD